MPNRQMRYPPPHEKAPDIPFSELSQNMAFQHSMPFQQQPRCQNGGNAMTLNFPNELLLMQQNQQQNSASENMQLQHSQNIMRAIISNGGIEKGVKYNKKHQQQHQRPEKPNSLPVLNCLFAALNKQTKEKDNEVTMISLI